MKRVCCVLLFSAAVFAAPKPTLKKGFFQKSRVELFKATRRCHEVEPKGTFLENVERESFEVVESLSCKKGIEYYLIRYKGDPYFVNNASVVLTK